MAGKLNRCCARKHPASPSDFDKLPPLHVQSQQYGSPRTLALKSSRMSDRKPRLTRAEVQKRYREKARDLDRDAAKRDDAKMDEMVRKNIEDHGA